jgi:hypothetical protein
MERPLDSAYLKRVKIVVPCLKHQDTQPKEIKLTKK